MKTTAIVIGILLLIVGALISLGVVSYPDSKTLFSVGDSAVTVATDKTPSRTLGYVLLVIGGVITAAAVATRKF